MHGDFSRRSDPDPRRASGGPRGRSVSRIVASSLALWLILAVPSAVSRATAEGVENAEVSPLVVSEMEAVDTPTPPAVDLILPEMPSEAMGFGMLGETVRPGEQRQLLLAVGESFAGMSLTTPVQVVHGMESGPSVCLVAGIHGDEVVGIEVVRRVVGSLAPQGMRGTVIAIPIANPLGFRRSSRYLPDRRDLNRYFPGRRDGSTASRLADSIFDRVIRRCQVLVDFHSGSFHRSNMPQVRADLRDPQLLGMAQWLGVPVVVHSRGRVGTLRRAATEAGILALLYEAGEPQRFDEGSVTAAVVGTMSLLENLGMIDGYAVPGGAADVFRGSHWIRAEEGGIFLSIRDLGDWVTTGTRLGTVTDPFTNEEVSIVARRTGRIIGRAHDQVVIPGYALYHIGTSQPGADADAVSDPDDPISDEFEERPE